MFSLPPGEVLRKHSCGFNLSYKYIPGLVWVFSIIQNASDPREPKKTNLTVEVNHSKIDKTTKNSNHKAQMYILELQNWLQDANLREVGFLLSELCMSRYLEVGGICLTWVQKMSCNYCVVPHPYAVPAKERPELLIHIYIPNQEQANVTMPLLSECVFLFWGYKVKALHENNCTYRNR